jgi:hypothetical protein
MIGFEQRTSRDEMSRSEWKEGWDVAASTPAVRERCQDAATKLGTALSSADPLARNPARAAMIRRRWSATSTM